MAIPRRKISSILEDIGDCTASIDELHVRRLLKEAQGLLKDPSSAVGAYAAMGMCFARLGRTKDAAEAHRCALRLDPKTHTHHMNLAAERAKQGELYEALEGFVQVLELTDARWPRLLACSSISECFRQLGNIDEAREALRDALSLLDLDDARMCFVVACSAADLEEDGLALEMLARAYTIRSGVGSGGRSPVEVIEATPSEVVGSFIRRNSLDRVVARAKSLPLGQLTALAPKQSGLLATPDAEQVLEQSRGAIHRASAAVLDS